eukprot:6196130-Pyramimonas_sp.AAC.1
MRSCASRRSRSDSIATPCRRDARSDAIRSSSSTLIDVATAGVRSVCSIRQKLSTTSTTE